ncbi:MAG TPA: hypothetical protein DCE80_08520 [Ignavibacteriales bacterium]|nr:hypothetical protein [Ignavibacteriales bacterium]
MIKMKKKDEYKSKDDIELVVHLEGKSSNSQLISLDDLTNLAAGINGLTHQIIKNKVGKARTSEQIKNLCLLGISKIKKGSAVLQISARQIGQLKIGLDTENILSDVIESMNKIENNDITSIDSQIFPYLDLITKPLTSENSKLNIDLYSKSKKIATSNTFTYEQGKKFRKLLLILEYMEVLFMEF